MNGKYVTNKFVEILKKNYVQNKIFYRCLELIDADYISILVNDNVFWFELRGKVPNYVLNYIISKMHKLGYKYISEV